MIKNLLSIVSSALLIASIANAAAAYEKYAGREYTSPAGREYTARPDYNQPPAQEQQDMSKPQQQRTQPQQPSPDQDKLRNIFNKVNEFLNK